MFTTLDEWKQERERLQAEAREATRIASEKIQRAIEVEEIVAEIEREKNGEGREINEQPS